MTKYKSVRKSSTSERGQNYKINREELRSAFPPRDAPAFVTIAYDCDLEFSLVG